MEKTQLSLDSGVSVVDSWMGDHLAFLITYILVESLNGHPNFRGLIDIWTGDRISVIYIN